MANVLHAGITRKIDQAHERLVVQLIRDGWLPTGECGADWWNRLFRRQVR